MSQTVNEFIKLYNPTSMKEYNDMMIRVVKKNQISDFLRSTDSLIKYGKRVMDVIITYEKSVHALINNPSYNSNAMRLTAIRVDKDSLSLIFIDGENEITIDMP